jgi:hypothetical protein
VDAEFRRDYPRTSNSELAARYRRSPVTILKWARALGLRKDPEYRRTVQSANARKRRLNADQRRSLSEKATGRKMAPETIAKIMSTKRERGSILRGAAHPFWKGGRPWARFKDPEYVRWRNAVLERDMYRCQACGRQCAKHEKGLAAHHILPYATHTEHRLDINNGITLCRRCHMSLHGRKLAEPEQRQCACGCGTWIPARDRYGRQRMFVNHHARRRRPTSAGAPRSS